MLHNELALEPVTGICAFVVWRLLTMRIVAEFKKTRNLKKLEIDMEASKMKTSMAVWLVLR